tara:strand:- start:498 stop:1073 length:576 start_codon:yes stop_codon:yes gene_type:complete
MGGYLGIDESNHGSNPETIVGVYSRDFRDLEEGRYAKQRNERREVHDFLESRAFRHILFPGAYAKVVGSTYAVQMVTIAELVKAFGGLEKVFVDGILNDSVLDKLDRAVHPESLPEIIARPNADREIKLVNIADAVAYGLSNYYLKEGMGIRNRYLRFLLTPRLEDYADLIGEFRKGHTARKSMVERTQTL